MMLTNLNDASQQVDFATAVRLGLGNRRGLFFPDRIAPLDDIDSVMAGDFHQLSTAVLGHIIGPGLDRGLLAEMVSAAFDFPLRLRRVSDKVCALELFHGPSLAFKDFGARFLAQCLHRFAGDQPTTILTATSGDTGAAVAHAFYGLERVRVVVLYPKGRVSPLQEKLFCTLGGNIETLAVDGDFDQCQALVKQAFDDDRVRTGLRLNSANSINVARLYAQVCYYFEAFRQSGSLNARLIAVPSGNFGNVTAGLLARCLGLPISRLLAATNENDTVPRFLASGRWLPNETVATLTNAMDISQPNNFPRVLKLATDHKQDLNQAIIARRISERRNLDAIRELHRQDYLADPHSALAYAGLIDELADETAPKPATGQQGIFLCTAHPAKFADALAAKLSLAISLPPALSEAAGKEILSTEIPADYALLRRQLLSG